MGKRELLITTNAILVAVVMVWIQGWWHTHSYYCENLLSTITAEISIWGLSLIAITSLINIFHSYQYKRYNMAKGILFLTLFLIVLAIFLNLVSVINKGFMGNSCEPLTFGLENSRVWVFATLSALSVIYLLILFIKPQCISKWGWWIALCCRRINKGTNRKDSHAIRTNGSEPPNTSNVGRISVKAPLLAGTIISGVIIFLLCWLLEANQIAGLSLGIIGQITIVFIVGVILAYNDERNPSNFLNRCKIWVNNKFGRISGFKWLEKPKAMTLMFLIIGFWFTVYSLSLQLYLQIANN